MSNIKILFGRKIKELRKRHNLTQTQLAELVNVDNKHISCIESGKNFPSSELLERFSKVFNIEIKKLFEFSYLQEPEDVKKEIISMLDELKEEELILAYKYISSFIL